MRRTHRYVSFIAALAALASLPVVAGAETLQMSTVETRLYVMVQAPEAALLKRLPPRTELNAYVQGPYKGANLLLLFLERSYTADPAGKPLGSTMDRKLVLVVPIKNPSSPKQAFMVIGGWSADPAEVPGAYKNFAPASELRRERSDQGSGFGFGTVQDAWTVSGGAGARVELRVRYTRSMATRIAPVDQHIYSSVDPAFYRIYRLDFGVEMVRSVPTGVDRAQDFRLSVKGAALADLFDGTEKIIGIVNVPWCVRQILLP